MRWTMARRAVKISLTLWMRMGRSHRVGRSRSIKGGRRMTIKGETLGAAAARDTCPTPRYILTSRPSIMERRRKEPILHNFKLDVVEVDLERSMHRLVNKKRIEWTLLSMGTPYKNYPVLKAVQLHSLSKFYPKKKLILRVKFSKNWVLLAGPLM